MSGPPGAHPGTLATGDLSINLTLAVFRPQTRREWVTWYAERHAARVALQRGGDDGGLVEAYGLDPDSIAGTVARWGGPRLPDDLFRRWFGTPTRRPAAPAPAIPLPVAERVETANRSRDIDDVLIERALKGDRTAVQALTAEDRVTVAGRMFVKGCSLTAVCKLLHVSGTEASKMVGAYRRRTEAGGRAA